MESTASGRCVRLRQVSPGIWYTLSSTCTGCTTGPGAPCRRLCGTSSPHCEVVGVVSWAERTWETGPGVGTAARRAWVCWSVTWGTPVTGQVLQAEYNGSSLHMEGRGFIRSLQ